MIVAAAVFMGFIIDRIFGDPVYSFHPVRIMGSFISKGEKILRNDRQNNIISFIFGTVLSLFLIALSFILPFMLLYVLYRIHIAAGIAVEIIFCYQIFAAKALKDESMRVYYALEKNDIPKARLYLSYIVGRDTQNLNEEEISKAAIETVAENL